jgi:hypothetical protein
MTCQNCKIIVTGNFDCNLPAHGTCIHCGAWVDFGTLIAKYEGKISCDGVVYHIFEVLVAQRCPSCGGVLVEWRIPCEDGEGGNFWRVEYLIREPAELISKQGMSDK